MTSSYSPQDASAAQLSPGVNISFREGLGAEQRAAVEQSVAGLVAHYSKAIEQARAAAAQRAALVAAASAPLSDLIRADPAAVRALEELGALRLEDTGVIEQVHPDRLPSAADESVALDLRSVRDAVEVRVPPYDFAWSWHHQAGGAPAHGYTHADGRIGLDARAGSISGGFSGFVNAHAGYGLFRRTAERVLMTGRSFKRMRYHYSVSSAGVASDATSEGGIEFTAMVNGQFLAGVSHKMWRKRVSGFESASYGEGPYTIHEPSELAFEMVPGRDYTFNVGIWTFADRTPGAGAAGAQSLIEGDVLAITLARD